MGKNSRLTGQDEFFFEIWKMFHFVGSLLETRRSNYRTVLNYGLKLDIIQAIRKFFK